MRVANGLARLHDCAFSPEPWQIALESSNVAAGLGQIVYTSSWDLDTYPIHEQQKTRGA